MLKTHNLHEVRVGVRFTWSLEVDPTQLHGIGGMVRGHGFAAGEADLPALGLRPFPRSTRQQLMAPTHSPAAASRWVRVRAAGALSQIWSVTSVKFPGLDLSCVQFGG